MARIPRAKHSVDLTDAGLKGFNPDPRLETVWDSALPGFGLRTRGRPDPAAWTWIYKYRHKVTRAQIKVTLGRFLALTPKAAREAAKAFEGGKAATHEDLWDKRRTDREAHRKTITQAAADKAAQAALPTVTQLWDRYWRAEGSAKKSGTSYEKLWKTHLSPAFGVVKVRDLTPSLIEEFKAERVKTPGACNRALALLSILLSRAVIYQWRQGCVPEHPMKGGGVKRYPETKVEFFFDEEQLGRLLEAADGYASEGIGLIFRMLALTGARASEVLTARWDQFSEADGGRLLWTVESTNTKQGRPITRALDTDLVGRLAAWKPTALALMKAPKVVALGAPQWVFPQANHPERHVAHLAKPWEVVKKRAGVKSGRVHDLRHTVATHMIRRGRSLTTVQKQLGHATIVTTQRYAHVMPEGVIDSGDLLGEIAKGAVAAARAKGSAEVKPISGGQP